MKQDIMRLIDIIFTLSPSQLHQLMQEIRPIIDRMRAEEEDYKGENARFHEKADIISAS